jgi:hypothetical protein
MFIYSTLDIEMFNYNFVLRLDGSGYIFGQTPYDLNKVMKVYCNTIIESLKLLFLFCIPYNPICRVDKRLLL